MSIYLYIFKIWIILYYYLFFRILKLLLEIHISRKKNIYILIFIIGYIRININIIKIYLY